MTKETEKSVEARELMARTYPRDYAAHNNLAQGYVELGRYEQAAEEARAAIRLNPNALIPYSNLANALRCLNRFDEVKEVYGQALAQARDRPQYHAALYDIALVQGDTAAMQRERDWMKGKPNEEAALAWQANRAAFWASCAKRENSISISLRHSSAAI